jgi:hypothetical protein
MNYHDTRFARQLGETPLRPDYASAIERTPGRQTRGDLAVKWTVLFGLMFVACLLVWEAL